MSLNPGSTIPQKITINVDEGINSFLCPGCKRVVASSKSFVVYEAKLMELELVHNNGTSYLKCRCGFLFEVIKCPESKSGEGYRFKNSLIVEK